jgi:hypothetical protein
MNTINKNLLYLILLLFPAFAFSQSNTCTIKISVEGQKQPVSIGLLHNGSSSNHGFNSGILAFTDSIGTPGMATLIVNYKNWFPKRNRFDIYLVPGTISVKVLTDKDSIAYLSIDGPALTIEYNDLLSVSVFSQVKVIQQLRGELDARQADSVQLKLQLNSALSRSFGVARSYIQGHPSSPLSIIALEMMRNGDPTNPHPVDDLQRLFDSLALEIKNSEKGKQYAQNLKAQSNANLKFR